MKITNTSSSKSGELGDEPSTDQRAEFLFEVSLSSIASSYLSSCSGNNFKVLQGTWLRSGILQKQVAPATIKKIHFQAYKLLTSKYLPFKAPEISVMFDGWSTFNRKYYPIYLRGLTLTDDKKLEIVERFYDVLFAPLEWRRS